MGVLSIQQEKALDRADQNDLFKFQEVWVLAIADYQIIRLLYNDVSVMVKVGGGLSVSIHVSRGIRQGSNWLE